MNDSPVRLSEPRLTEASSKGASKRGFASSSRESSPSAPAKEKGYAKAYPFFFGRASWFKEPTRSRRLRVGATFSDLQKQTAAFSRRGKLARSEYASGV